MVGRRPAKSRRWGRRSSEKAREIHKSELLAKKEQCHRRRKDWQREKSDQIVRKLA